MAGVFINEEYLDIIWMLCKPVAGREHWSTPGFTMDPCFSPTWPIVHFLYFQAILRSINFKFSSVATGSPQNVNLPNSAAGLSPTKVTFRLRKLTCLTQKCPTSELPESS